MASHISGRLCDTQFYTEEELGFEPMLLHLQSEYFRLLSTQSLTVLWTRLDSDLVRGNFPSETLRGGLSNGREENGGLLWFLSHAGSSGAEYNPQTLAGSESKVDISFLHRWLL